MTVEMNISKWSYEKSLPKFEQNHKKVKIKKIFLKQRVNKSNIWTKPSERKWKSSNYLVFHNQKTVARPKRPPKDENQLAQSIQFEIS